MKPLILSLVCLVPSFAYGQPRVYEPRTPLELMWARAWGLQVERPVVQPAPARGAPNLVIVRTHPRANSSGTATTQAKASLVENPDGKFNSESGRMFATKVQPILNNLCANCHTRSDRAGDFVLKRFDENHANAEAAEHNLRAAVRYLNAENPTASALLTMMVTAHGGAKDPPLRVKAVPAYRTLEYWAYWATLPEGTPMPAGVPISPPKSTLVIHAASTPKTGFAAGDVQQAGAIEPAAKPATVPHITNTPAEPGKLPPLTPSTDPPKPVTNTAPATPSGDPYDPDTFNRYAFPNRK